MTKSKAEIAHAKLLASLKYEFEAIDLTDANMIKVITKAQLQALADQGDNTQAAPPSEQFRPLSREAKRQRAQAERKRDAQRAQRKAEKIAAHGGVNPDARWNAPENLRKCPNCHRMHVAGGTAERECLELIRENSPNVLSRGQAEAEMILNSVGQSDETKVAVAAAELFCHFDEGDQNQAVSPSEQPLRLLETDPVQPVKVADLQRGDLVRSTRMHFTNGDGSPSEGHRNWTHGMVLDPAKDVLVTDEGLGTEERVFRFEAAWGGKTNPSTELLEWRERMLKRWPLECIPDDLQPFHERIPFTIAIQPQCEFCGVKHLPDSREANFCEVMREIMAQDQPEKMDPPIPVVLTSMAAKLDEARAKTKPGIPIPDSVAPKPMPKTKAKSKTKTPKKASVSAAKINKSQFIRDRLHLEPQEIIAEAKAANLKIRPAAIYNLRSIAKKNGEEVYNTPSEQKKKGASKRAPAPASVATKPTKTATSNTAKQRTKQRTEEVIPGLSALALEYGTRTIRQELERIERESKTAKARTEEVVIPELRRLALEYGIRTIRQELQRLEREE